MIGVDELSESESHGIGCFNTGAQGRVEVMAHPSCEPWAFSYDIPEYLTVSKPHHMRKNLALEHN